MTHYRISEAAGLLGVSDDTVRRWIASDGLPVSLDDAGRQVIDGADLAQRAQERAQQALQSAAASGSPSSARNRMVGLVTGILSDTVMSQVELQCGPHRIVSLMSTEAVRDLKLEIGSLAVAVVKATMVVVEAPKDNS
ncbi:TOBE domain-containing protein [Salinibacterium sp. NSLL150]|uniref:TOBE domain-containing protein n=1 Tax=unclassified Salinibacterium TaxID=2632331 RepID=UPI0018CD2A51|nr:MULTISPECIES: TOBE domain-containing protein [unclassified Salinibacterium]MBH0098153.1 TOBE domain-containing protein [Salinibacterium sp. NSLL35]MBH0100908.1 TOBE domain-containing protein [Salinibacterium sp. NSLL150]MBH0103667.1 TOBE domain-containing protein [Salinibacterium sp. NSLL16]MBH0106428.1 TOBE domain-containing protein [Salinibacterium sp. NSLL17]